MLAGTNEGAIVSLIANEISENIVVGADQNLVLNTNGKTLTSVSNTIVNNGTLEITGNGMIKGTEPTEAKGAISNYGQLVINSGNVDSNMFGIVNYESANVVINGGQISSTKIYAINNVSTGNIVLNNGIIRGMNGIRNHTDCTGKIIVNGGTIITSMHAIRNYIGSIEVNNGEIISNNGDGIWTNLPGTIVVTGGIIKGCTNGIIVHSGSGEGQIIIGVNDANVCSNNPIIIATNGTGVSGANIKFYDGTIKSVGRTISQSGIIDFPQGYQITDGEDEIIDGVTYHTTIFRTLGT